MSESEILTVSEAAELLRLKKSTIYFYVESRRLPHLKVGGKLLFEKAALIEWLIGHRVEPVPSVR